MLLNFSYDLFPVMKLIKPIAVPAGTTPRVLFMSSRQILIFPSSIKYKAS